MIRAAGAPSPVRGAAPHVANAETAPPLPPELSARNLVARYAGQPLGSAAVAAVTLTVAPGERLVLLGPNGAGKSTFLRVFSGLMRPASGLALIDGQPAARIRHLVGVVGHATLLYDDLTAEENLRLYSELYDVQDARGRARGLLGQVGLESLAGERVRHLSRGQQQRVAIARALVHDPPVLLLDEPDTGLDLAAFHLLEELALARPRTIVLTTHNVAAGLRLATRVAILSRGRLVHEHAGATPRDADEVGALLRDLATTAAGALVNA